MYFKGVTLIYLIGKFLFTIITVLFLSLIPEDLSGQSDSTLKEYLQLNTSSPGEKVYMHTDRPNYVQGDTIWFKAYSWFGFEQAADTMSGVLYADLLGPGGGVLQKRKLLIHNGTSHGDFTLGNDISPGIYILRAYTRWMQNMNTGDPFYKNVLVNKRNQNFHVECNPVIIKQSGNDSLRVKFRFFEMNQEGELVKPGNHQINYSLKIGNQLLHSGNVTAENTKEEVFKWSLPGSDLKDSVAIFEMSVKDDRLTFEKQFQIPLNDPVDIQFFPEGGSMVSGIKNKVAFKAIGKDGLSREVNGEIKDDKGEVITAFKSIHKGMGEFMLKPVTGKEYFAHLLFNKRLYIIPLPHALHDGCGMSVSNRRDSNNLQIIIKQPHSVTVAKKYLAGSAYGKINFIFPFEITGDSCLLKIPLDLFPEGISVITILNTEFYPQRERLVYIDKNERFKIEIKTDSLSYGIRSKVTLLVKASGYDGRSVQSEMSLAVVDKGQIINNQFTSICAYKLLQSELQGNIEDADFYFRNDSCVDQSALDLLMLTQGYRKFLPAGKNIGGQKFQPERNFEVSGIIKLPGKGARIKKYDYSNIRLTLLCRSDGMYLDQSGSDSLGRFRFQIPLLNGKSNSLIQATTSKEKPFFGEIMLNETITKPQFTIPLPDVTKLVVPVVEYVSQVQAVKKSESSKSPWVTSMSKTLGEVTITAKSKNWYRNFEPNAQKIADLDSLDPDGNRYQNIYDLLVREFGAERYFNPHSQLKTIKLPSYGMQKMWSSSWFPIYVINGKTYFNGGEDFKVTEDGVMFVTLLNNLSVIGVNEIKRLMVIPPGNIASYYADDSLKIDLHQSLVVIETYSENTFRGDPSGIKTFVLEGLDAPRAYYSPRYESSRKNPPEYDGRATLFWEPVLKTDSCGYAKIEFFTSDRETNMEVIVNGIEDVTGHTGHINFLIRK